MYLFSASHGHGTSSCAVGSSGAADRVQARDELAVVAEHVERGLAHAGHDPHVHRDVGGVGELDADVGDRRAERAHGERARRTSCGPSSRPRKSSSSSSRISAGSRQLLVGPASSSRSRADEGAVLDAGDVAGVGEGQVAVRALGVGQSARTCRRRRASWQSAVVLLRGAVAPVDRVGLGERGHLLDPAEQFLVVRGDSCGAHVRIHLGMGFRTTRIQTSCPTGWRFGYLVSSAIRLATGRNTSRSATGPNDPLGHLPARLVDLARCAPAPCANAMMSWWQWGSPSHRPVRRWSSPPRRAYAPHRRRGRPVGTGRLPPVQGHPD